MKPQYIQFGASPRASINLNLASKAVAYMDGRDYVLPEDIKEVALDVMNHRILLNYEAEADAVKTSDIIKALLSKVPIIQIGYPNFNYFTSRSTQCYLE